MIRGRESCQSNTTIYLILQAGHLELNGAGIATSRIEEESKSIEDLMGDLLLSRYEFHNRTSS